MAKSFFKVLATIEDEIILSESSEYSDETKSIIYSLIAFVEGGTITEASIAKFICRNFRLDNKSLLRAYNLSVPYEKMISTSTLRSYISRLSNELYDIFGLNIYEIFKENNLEKQRKIKSLLNISNLEDLNFEDLFVNIVDEKASTGLVNSNICLDDCEEELKVLKLLTKMHLREMLSGLDANKLAYIKRVLNKPIVNSKTLNYDKISLLQYFNDLN